MDAIGLARGRGILTNPPRGEADLEPEEGPNRRTQHYKPDLLLVRTDLNDRLDFIIADVTAGSDDKLILEDEYTRYILAREKTHDKLTDHMRSNKFTDEGRITRTGLQELHQAMRPDVERVHYFKQSHYAKRYASLVRVLREAGGGGMHSGNQGLSGGRVRMDPQVHEDKHESSPGSRGHRLRTNPQKAQITNTQHHYRSLEPLSQSTQSLG
jgi:hypothetical protein